MDATTMTFLRMSSLRLIDIDLLLARTQYLQALYLQSQFLCERMFDSAYDWNRDDYDTGYRAVEGMALEHQIRVAEMEVEESTAVVLASLST